MQLDGTTMAITGAGGFIGLRMVETARARGLSVRGLELSVAAARRAEAAGAVTQRGDVCDPAAAEALCRGADVVFHTAAIVEEDGPMELFRRVNVEGTRTIARAAQGAGVRRFVHLSSVMVYGFAFPADVDEGGPLRGEGNPYCQTKIESEEAALSFHEPGRMEVTVLRPGDVYGPGSIPWVVRPVDMIRRRLFALPGGGRGKINHVWVDNLLDAVFLALERDATGQAFNVTDGRATEIREFFGHYLRMLGRGRPPSIPAPVLVGLFRIVEKGASLVGTRPPLRAAGIRFLMRPHAYSIEKARQVLGYEPAVSLEQGMAIVERWLRQEGRI